MNTPGNVAISADGVPIHYDMRGTDLPALVFVHGWSCDRTYWEPQVCYFAQQYQVVAIDLAGHGASGRGRAQWTMPAFGQDVVSVVERLRLKQVVLIGHSMGGAVAVEAARRLSASVIGVVGVDTWSNIDRIRTPEQIASSLAPFRANFVEATRAAVRRMFVPTSDPTLVERIVAAMSAAPPHIGIGAGQAYGESDRNLQAGFHEVKSPKVTINSGSWGVTNMEVMQRYGIEVMLMSGVGHFVMLEDPQTFNRLLDEAVQKCLHARTPQEERKPRVGPA
jgi:pimeloyl-ACP methyl ester carboxylesterase